MEKNAKIYCKKLNPFTFQELKLFDSPGLCKRSKATQTVRQACD